MSQTASEPFLPASLEEASALIAEAAAEGRTLRIGEALRLDRMARILHHAPGDLTCTVEAGVRLSELHAAVEAHGQRLSLDPPGDPTIGACVAANLSGPLRHRFGAPRDLVLGVTLVLGDGAIASSGGTVVKNVAGYDLGKLVCGSRGALGLIGRVALRLHPVPASSATLVVETDDAGAGRRDAARRSHLQPSALDVLHPGRVAVLFEGSAAAVDAQLTAALRARRRRGGGPDGLGGEPSTASDGRGLAQRSHLVTSGDALGVEPEAVVRPSAGVAYVPHVVEPEVDSGVERLRRALQERFDPAGVLA